MRRTMRKEDVFFVVVGMLLPSLSLQQYTSTLSTCNKLTVLTGVEGYFGVGEPYSNSLRCGWIIQPANAVSIHLDIEYKLEFKYDFLDIGYYNASLRAMVSPFALRMTGPTSGRASHSVTLQTDRVFVQFYTDSTVTDLGFSIYFTATTSDAGCNMWAAQSSGNIDFSKSSTVATPSFCTWFAYSGTQSSGSPKTRFQVEKFTGPSSYYTYLGMTLLECNVLYPLSDQVVLAPTSACSTQVQTSSLQVGESIYAEQNHAIASLYYYPESYDYYSATPYTTSTISLGCCWLAALRAGSAFQQQCTSSTTYTSLNTCLSNLVSSLAYYGSSSSYYTKCNGFYNTSFCSYSREHSSHRPVQQLLHTRRNASQHARRQLQQTSQNYEVLISYGLACDSGSIALSDGKCLTCPMNTFVNGSQCSACPNNSFTVRNGSQYCLCNSGHFYDSNSHQCVSCPSGTYSMNEAVVLVRDDYMSNIDVIARALGDIEFAEINVNELQDSLPTNPMLVIVPASAIEYDDTATSLLYDYIMRGGNVVLLDVSSGTSASYRMGINIGFQYMWDVSVPTSNDSCIPSGQLQYAPCISALHARYDYNGINLSTVFQGQYQELCTTVFEADYGYGHLIGLSFEFQYQESTWSGLLGDFANTRPGTQACSVDVCRSCPSGLKVAGTGGSVDDCQCDKGYALSWFTGQCVPCTVGTYKDFIGNGVCQSCPADSVTISQASGDVADCLCKAQFFRNGSKCSACPAGTRKLTVGNEACQACSINADSACQCLPGYENSNCTACPAGKYKDVSGSGQCQTCPGSFKSSLPAAKSVAECVCAAGYTLGSGGSCVACEAGKYKSFIGNSACVTCPTSMSSLPGSTDCSCGPGFEPAADGCVVCPNERYKSSVGNVSCQLCPNLYTAATDHRSCVCSTGHGLNSASQVCESCAVGTFKSQAGNLSCTACPSFSSTVTTGASVVDQCLCNKGYSNSSTLGSCIQCAAGKYKSTLGNTTCSQCNNFSTSLAGSMDVTDCRCNAGYGKMVQNQPNIKNFAGSFRDNTCGECPVSTYSGAADDICRACPSLSSTTSTGSGSITSCLCVGGRYASFTFGESLSMVCESCPAGTYSKAGALKCTACTVCEFAQERIGECPDVRCVKCDNSSYYDVQNSFCTPCTNCNATVKACSTLEDSICQSSYGDCPACADGKYLSSSTSCTCLSCQTCSTGKIRIQCGMKKTDGTYSNGECISCPVGFYSASANDKLCSACQPGYYSGALGSTVCTQCPANTYSNLAGIGSSACSDCPANTASTPGSTSCVCMLGYRGLGDQCSACDKGTFSNRTGSSSCLTCPQFQTTAATAATSLTDCTCIEGYTLVSGHCVACAAGKYKDETGPAACTDCPADSYSSAAGTMCQKCTEHSTSLAGSPKELCLCLPGYTSDGEGKCTACEKGSFSGGLNAICLKCAEGTYSGMPGSSSCTLCPAKTGSPAGSTSITNCSCDAGYAGSGVSCYACPAGSYKAFRGDGSCSSCGPMSNCSIGFYKPDCAEGSPFDTPCMPCTKKPHDSSFTSNGGNSDSCSYKCNVGFQYNCQTDSCQICQPDLEYYSPTDEVCKSCPAGATCDGQVLIPKVAGSVWELYNGVYRIKSCPAGYVLVRSQGDPLLDDCVMCPTNYYSPIPSDYYTNTQAVQKASVALSLCIPCNLQMVDCPGGSQQIAKEGYWTLGSLPARRSKGNKTLTVPVYRCPPSACQSANNCTEGRQGVLCALCADGYFMAGSAYGAECKPCAGNFQALQKLGQALFVLGMAGVWFVLVVMPLLGLSKAAKEAASTFSTVKGQLMQIWEYIRVAISFMQVSSSFATSFNVPWPVEVRNILSLATAFKFDLFAFSGVHCLLAGMSYEDKINLYGLGPVLTGLCLYLPVLFVKKVGPKAIREDSFLPLCVVDRFKKWLFDCFGRRSARTAPEENGEPVATPRNLASKDEGMTDEDIQEQLTQINKYNAHVRERVWFWLLFWCFLIYPLLSIFSTSGYVCTTVGDERYLLIDFSLKCPLDDVQHPLFWKILLLLLAYPFGLPLFFVWTLWRHEVPRLANIKYNNLLFIEVLKEYKTKSESKERSDSGLISKITSLLNSDPFWLNRLLITQNLSTTQLEEVLNFNWWTGGAMQELDITSQGWLSSTGNGDESKKGKAQAKANVKQLQQDERRKNKKIVLGEIRTWYDDMAKALEGSDDGAKAIYRKRQEWCKTVHKWVSELDDWWFDERYPVGTEGQDLFKCIFFVSNKLFYEARSVVMLGQEVLDRHRTNLSAEARRASHDKEKGENLDEASKNLTDMKYLMRICESLWIYDTCKKLDVDDSQKVEGMANEEDSGEMLPGEETPNLKEVMDSDAFWSCIELSRSENGGGNKNSGVIDIEELQTGFVKLSWYSFFGNTSPTTAKTMFDSLSLPGWQRAYPAGPARMHDWNQEVAGAEVQTEEEIAEREEETRNERHRRRSALKRAAKEFFQQENIKSSFPMPLEVIVHRMQEVKLKESIILLGKRLEFQGVLAVPICRWLTADEIQKMEDQLTEAESSPGDQDKVAEVSEGGVGPNSMQESKEERLVVVNDDFFQVEKVAVNQAGFIFKAYKANYWYFELVEMLRKFLMMGTVNFIYPDSPQQLAAGFVISLFSLLLAIYLSPYVNRKLNFAYQAALFTQTLTLFYAIMLHIQTMQGSLDQAVTDPSATKVMTGIVLLLNFSIVALPWVIWSMDNDLAYQVKSQLFRRSFTRKWISDLGTKLAQGRLLNQIKNFVLYPVHTVDASTIRDRAAAGRRDEASLQEASLQSEAEGRSPEAEVPGEHVVEITSPGDTSTASHQNNENVEADPSDSVKGADDLGIEELTQGQELQSN